MARAGPGIGALPDILIQSQQPNPQAQQRNRQLQANPLVQTFRAFLGCSYLTALSTDDAKAKGIVPTARRGKRSRHVLGRAGDGALLVRPAAAAGGRRKPQGGAATNAVPVDVAGTFTRDEVSSG